jgi:hypothetical protein
VLRLQATLAGGNVDGAQPYASLREAYSDVTGYDAFRLNPQQFASTFMESANSRMYDSAKIRMTIDENDWAVTFGTALYREVIRQYQLPTLQEWKQIVSKFGNLKDMREVNRIRTGYFDTLPTVAKGGPYQELTDPSEEAVAYTPSKRGGTESFYWEDVLNDDLSRLAEIPGKLAMAAKLTVWYYVFDVIANATPPTMDYDSIALFHASHSNLGSTALSTTSWEAARIAMMKQSVPSATNMKIGLRPKYLVVPPDLEPTALKLRNGDYDPDGGTSNPLSNIWKNTFEVIVIPFWSDADAWAAIADPSMCPTIEVGFLGGKEDPDIAQEAPNTGSNFTADKIVYRVRQVFGVKALDHRGMYKAVP